MARSAAGAGWAAWGALSVGLHLGLVFYGLVPNLVNRPVHLALALPWIFVYGAQTPWARRTGWALASAGMLGCAWIALRHDALGDQYGFLESPFQVALAIALLVVVMEGARRAIGWPLPLLALLSLLYGLGGQYLPGEFGHSGTPLSPRP